MKEVFIGGQMFSIGMLLRFSWLMSTAEGERDAAFGPGIEVFVVLSQDQLCLVENEIVILLHERFAVLAYHHCRRPSLSSS